MSKTVSRYRNFELIIYPEDLEYDNFVDIDEFIANIFYDVEYAYCCHDKDGVKKHYHLGIFLPNAMTLNAFYNKYLLSVYEREHLLNFIHSKVAFLQYLIHWNDNSKYQYPLSDIISNFDISPYFAAKKSDSQLLDVFISLCSNANSFVDGYYFDPHTFLRIAIDNDMLHIYRRYYNIIKDYFKNRR